MQATSLRGSATALQAVSRVARWPDSEDGRPTATADRLLRLFGDVRHGEGPTVLTLLATLFVILCGYYICKTVREPLILADRGAEVKAYASGLQALVLMAAVPAYSRLAAHVSRRTLLVGMTLFFVVNLEIFWLLGVAGVPWLGVAFFVWVGIFNNAVIAQFWSYANDLYTPERGSRLFPVIAIGATFGSPVGAWVAGRLFDAGVSALTLLHLAAACLLVSLAGYLRVEGWHSASPPATRGNEGGSRDGFALLARNPYLRLICLLLLLLNVVNTTGEYILSREVLSMANASTACAGDSAREACIGGFYGRYFFWVNIAAIVIQSLLVSRLVRVAGIAGLLLVLPMASLVTYAMVLSGAGFQAFRWSKTIENATDYSAMNTARQMLWLPTARREKYAAKQAADTFIVRAGDVLAAGLVFAGTTWLSMERQAFAGALMVVIAMWIGVAWLLVTEYRRQQADVAPAS
ncbi:NTP/NDP exchange transporter [Luteitalea pratensis]|nr:translocase [Luteitalea pratensis]